MHFKRRIQRKRTYFRFNEISHLNSANTPKSAIPKFQFLPLQKCESAKDLLLISILQRCSNHSYSKLDQYNRWASEPEQIKSFCEVSEKPLFNIRALFLQKPFDSLFFCPDLPSMSKLVRLSLLKAVLFFHALSNKVQRFDRQCQASQPW